MKALFASATCALIAFAAATPAFANGALECQHVFNPEHNRMHKPLSQLVSMEGTVDNGELREGLLPRGSALMTSSGALRSQGIVAIIHAATGSMMKQGGHYEPSLDSIRLSVSNSVALAEKNGYKKIAIPLLGGGIFLNRIGKTPKELATEIIVAALEAQTSVELHFVAFAEADVQAFREGRDVVRAVGHIPGLDDVVKVDQGSITDFRVHGAPVIVNAANTEVIFGGGLSGIIAKATDDSQAINAEAAGVIAEARAHTKR